MNLPSLTSSSDRLNAAFRIAIGDIASNIVPYHEGQLNEPRPCLAAGVTYPGLWTRDTALNLWNATGLLLPEVSENSLRAVLTEDPERGGWRIGGQYWDAIIWAQGAWAYYLYQGNRAFLSECLEIVERSLTFFEDTEFDMDRNLFRGPAFFQDGISGYPDECVENFVCEILDWPKANADKAVKCGVGIPWFALSTNCLYVGAYQTVQAMRRELSLPESDDAARKEEHLKLAIREAFWNTERGSFDYLLFPDGRRCAHQEGAGLAFALLFEVPTEEQTASLFANVYRAPAGIPCIWPTFPRYANFSASHIGDSHGQTLGTPRFGRHSGTVWPHVQALWARAALREGKTEFFDAEFRQLTDVALRDGQFTEIFHPLTGQEYGGLQEHYWEGYIMEWASVPRNVWGATGFLSLIHTGLLGMTYMREGISFAPYLPAGIENLSLRGLTYRKALLRISVQGAGDRIKRFRLNGKETAPFLPAGAEGPQEIQVEVEVA